MIRAKELHGRAVIDLDTAERLGDVHEVILDPETRQVAAIVATSRPAILGGGDRVLIPSSAVHAIGEDAVTVSRHEMGSETEAPSAALDALPRLSDITGRKVVTESGTAAGEIDDVMLDETTGRITGYALGDHGPGALGEFLAAPNTERRRHTFEYVRAESDLRVGPDVIVVPDDAVVREERREQADVPARPEAPTGPTMHEPLGRQPASPAAGASRTARTARWSAWAAPEGYTSPWRREGAAHTESHVTTPRSVDTGRMP